MRRVLVVGAGGSLAEAVGYRPVRLTAFRPPLDLNFFVRASELEKKATTVRQGLRRFRRALNDAGTFADPWRPVPSSLEQFFADAYYEVATSRSKAALEVFISLLDLYARVLEETTNWMASRVQTGSVGRLIRTELQRAGDDQLTIVTFNHDLVIETEVNRVPKLRGGWCLYSLYSRIGLDPIYSGAGAAQTFPQDDDDDCEHEPPISLLKLHGSLNWVLRTRSPDPELGTLFPPPSGRRRTVFVHDFRTPVHYGSRVGPGDPGGRAWYVWPLIVPPIYDKQRVTGTRLFQDVWGRAQQAILEAEHLTLVGYSLPDADVFARQMLRRAFWSNALLDRISVVNPDGEIVTKLRSVLAPSVVRAYSDISSYLDHSSE